MAQQVVQSWIVRPPPGYGAHAGAMTAHVGAVDTSAVSSSISAGDTYMNASPPEYDSAVEAYKAAGAAAVDLSKSNGLTVPFGGGGSGDANAQLAAINSTPYNNVAATQSDASQAQGLANTILQQLNAAAAGGGGTANQAALQAAAQNLLSYLVNSGVPPEASYDATVYAFQVAYTANGGTLNGGTDGKYGPSTASALAQTTGANVPAPNTGGSVTPPHPPTPVTPGGGGTGGWPWWAWALLLLGGGGAVGLAVRQHQKREHETTQRKVQFHGRPRRA